MIADKSFISIMFLLAVHSATTCAISRDSNQTNEGRDTVLIASTNQTIILDINRHSNEVEFSNLSKKQFDPKLNYSLSFERVLMEKQPEGVYEIYLTPFQAKANELHPNSTFFVNVIDTYKLADLKGQRYIVNLTKINFLNTEKTNNNFYLTVLFRGNNLPNTGIATDAGKLIISGIRLIQLNK